MKTFNVIAASVVLAASSAAFADQLDNDGNQNALGPRANLEDPAWVQQLDAEHEARMNERPESAQAPAFETPAWVKELDAEREARMNERPAFGERPEFAEAPALETPAWVKELDAQHEARMNEMPAFGEIPEIDAAELESPDFKEMDERHAQFIKESDERRAARKQAFEERRAASKKRHEEFMQKFNKVSTEEAVEEAPAAEQQS